MKKNVHWTHWRSRKWCKTLNWVPTSRVKPLGEVWLFGWNKNKYTMFFSVPNACIIDYYNFTTIIIICIYQFNQGDYYKIYKSINSRLEICRFFYLYFEDDMGRVFFIHFWKEWGFFLVFAKLTLAAICIIFCLVDFAYKIENTYMNKLDLFFNFFFTFCDVKHFSMLPIL